MWIDKASAVDWAVCYGSFDGRSVGSKGRYSHCVRVGNSKNHDRG